MNREIENKVRVDKLTAVCNDCGETTKEFLSTFHGLGWNCDACGYLTKAQVQGIAKLEAPTYKDGSPVIWIKPMR